MACRLRRSIEFGKICLVFLAPALTVLDKNQNALEAKLTEARCFCSTMNVGPTSGWTVLHDRISGSIPFDAASKYGGQPLKVEFFAAYYGLASKEFPKGLKFLLRLPQFQKNRGNHTNQTATIHEDAIGPHSLKLRSVSSRLPLV